jgi:hypothetical protein
VIFEIAMTMIFTASTIIFWYEMDRVLVVRESAYLDALRDVVREAQDLDSISDVFYKIDRLRVSSQTRLDK